VNGDEVAVAVLVPMFAIFALFIALPWMILNFIAKRRQNAALAAGDPAMTASLGAIADKLERRLDAIETILDHEVPGWRRNLDRRTS
jgi:phage shock protein B